MVTDTRPQVRPTTLAAMAGRGWRALVWFIKGVTGESKYDSYLAHERAVHPDREPMTPAEYWRCVYSEQDANPGSRCC
ncbi:YbdD/YjiX family protein [Microbacterium sp. JZ31]|uniref:YbdD/YjiX family protein n=1 Tax=Microbacterium sp. JZ31 TaxID=1906274 RepID=UPI001EE3D908|nr:YbdD/YjiX family protein [Microbacterium sp. JZ31]